MGTDHDGASTPESEAAEEADWALATAATLQAKGDLDGARTWFRRAVEHLMDAGLDDRALVVAKQAAALTLAASVVRRALTLTPLGLASHADATPTADPAPARCTFAPSAPP